MKIIVCGGRDYADWIHLSETLDYIHGRTPIIIVLHGNANGADKLAARWAHGRAIPGWPFPADWEKYGKAAGIIRNRQMLAEKPDLVVAFPGGRGTAHMVGIAREAGVEVMEA